MVEIFFLKNEMRKKVKCYLDLFGVSEFPFWLVTLEYHSLNVDVKICLFCELDTSLDHVECIWLLNICKHLSLESQPAIALVCRSVWGTGESAAFEPISGCYILGHTSVNYLSLERLGTLTFLSKNKMIKKLQ